MTSRSDCPESKSPQIDFSQLSGTSTAAPNPRVTTPCTWAASGTAATCTGKTNRRPRRVSVASTGWPRKAAAGRPPSPAPATTTTAGTRTRTRAGPGATSVATPASLRSGFAKTCAVQLQRRLPKHHQLLQPSWKRSLRLQVTKRHRCFLLLISCQPGARQQRCSQ